jgi:hypothetical protein
MTADKNPQKGVGSARTDKIGKVFTVLSEDLRQCLICEGVFTCRAASEHAKVVCMPGVSTTTGSR